MNAPGTLSPSTTGAHAAIAHYFDDLEGEFDATRRLLARFPDAHADWRPHEKSTPLAHLAAHVAQLPSFASVILTTDELDFATHPYSATTARTATALLALHDRTTAEAREALTAMTPERLDAQWTLRAGNQIFLRDRRGKLLRQNLVGHVAHHRGQLSVYYRLLGVPVPGMYGPSADDK
ncbi:MAG: hypothetical protein NVS4B3_12830 [Gemmatimonadaceae bacterium]